MSRPAWRRIALFAIALLITAGCGPCDVFDSGPPWVDMTSGKLVGVWSTSEAGRVQIEFTSDHHFYTDAAAAFGRSARSGTWSLDTPAENIAASAVVGLAFERSHGVGPVRDPARLGRRARLLRRRRPGRHRRRWSPEFRLTKCTKHCPKLDDRLAVGRVDSTVQVVPHGHLGDRALLRDRGTPRPGRSARPSPARWRRGVLPRSRRTRCRARRPAPAPASPRCTRTRGPRRPPRPARPAR